MILNVARKELRDLVRDGRFRWSSILVGALLLVSLGHGWVQAREAEREHAAAQATAREHWESQGEKNPHSAAHYGVYAFKPRLALSFVDEGVDPYTGTSVWLEAHRQNDFLLRPAQDATAAQRIGALTAAQVLQHLVPLLIILLTFGALAGERERGTLRQLLATGIGRRELALGKALGVAGALTLLLVPAALVGAGALVVGSPGPAASPLARAAVLAFIYLAYFGASAAPPNWSRESSGPCSTPASTAWSWTCGTIPAASCTRLSTLPACSSRTAVSSSRRCPGWRPCSTWSAGMAACRTLRWFL